jgi:hypothetical protein
MKTKNAIPAQIFAVLAVASLVVIHNLLSIGLLIAVAIVVVGFWVYFELAIVLEHIGNVIYGCKNVKIKTEAIFIAFSSEPDNSKLTNERLRSRILLCVAIGAFPAVPAIILAAVFKTPEFILLAVLYIEIAVYSLFFAGVNANHMKTLREIKSDPDYVKKMKLVDTVSKELAEGKLCCDYPEGTFIEPTEIKNQWDFILGIYTISYLGGKYEESPEFEREAKQVCERLISKINKDIPENLVNVLKLVYLELMIICGDPNEKITAYYESIRGYLTVLATDGPLQAGEKEQAAYAYNKLIKRDNQAAEEIKKRLLETLSKVTPERLVTQIKKEIDRIDRLAETITN